MNETDTAARPAGDFPIEGLGASNVVQDAVLSIALRNRPAGTAIVTDVNTRELLSEVRELLDRSGTPTGSIRFAIADEDARWVRCDPFATAAALTVLVWGATDAGRAAGLDAPRGNVVARATPGDPSTVTLDVVPGGAGGAVSDDVQALVRRAEGNLASQGIVTHRAGGRVRVLLPRSEGVVDR